MICCPVREEAKLSPEPSVPGEMEGSGGLQGAHAAEKGVKRRSGWAGRAASSCTVRAQPVPGPVLGPAVWCPQASYLTWSFTEVSRPKVKIASSNEQQPRRKPALSLRTAPAAPPSLSSRPGSPPPARSISLNPPSMGLEICPLQRWGYGCVRAGAGFPWRSVAQITGSLTLTLYCLLGVILAFQPRVYSDDQEATPLA